MGAVRRAVIFVAQILALIFIVLATTAGALAGDEWFARAVPMISRATKDNRMSFIELPPSWGLSSIRLGGG